MSRDEIQRQINSINDSRQKNITIKRIRTNSNIKTKCKGMQLKK